MITATDAKGCTKTTSITVIQPPVLGISNVSNTIPTCSPGNDATLSFNGTGGVSPYSFAISPKQAIHSPI